MLLRLGVALLGLDLEHLGVPYIEQAVGQGRDTARRRLGEVRPQFQEADQAIVGYLRERFKGTRPIAAGRQLQELWMVMGMYVGALGLESLIDREPAEPAREVVDAQR